MKVQTIRGEDVPTRWDAWASYWKGKVSVSGYLTKNAAIRCAKKELKVLSVRGLLCYPCNAGLRHYKDRPSLFRAAAKYLEAHQGVA